MPAPALSRSAVTPARRYCGEVHVGQTLRLVLFASLSGVEIEVHHLHATGWVLEDVEVIGHPAALARYLERVSAVTPLVVGVVHAWAEARRLRDGARTIDLESVEVPAPDAVVVELDPSVPS